MATVSIAYKYALSGTPEAGFTIGAQDESTGWNMSYNGSTLDALEAVTGNLQLQGDSSYTGLATWNGFVVKNVYGTATTYWLFSQSAGLSGSLGTEAQSSLMVENLACFARGTLILTSRGEVPVEDICAADLVATKFGGLRPVLWIGRQSFEGRLALPAMHPVRFKAGSLGGDRPSCDLLVSPGHAILVGDVLVHAEALVNGLTITQERIAGLIEYFHLDLGPHDCMLANSTWAESYFDDMNRNVFHNAADFIPQPTCAADRRQRTCLPILTKHHPGVAELRQRLAGGTGPLSVAV